ncbi:hypothetical protein [Microbacterium sp. S16(2024)]
MPTERPNQLGRTSDQASPEEIGYARYLAYKAQGTTATRVDGTPGYEFIAADVKTQGVPAGERHIEVLSYDYSTDTSILQVVDLVDGTVTETRGGAATAPPSARESLFAMDLLIRSDEATDIRAAFAERTGEELTSPSQVSYVSSAQLPAGTRYLAPQCEGHRCVVFQPHFGADVALYYGDVVVDLSASQVYRVS